MCLMPTHIEANGSIHRPYKTMKCRYASICNLLNALPTVIVNANAPSEAISNVICSVHCVIRCVIIYINI